MGREHGGPGAGGIAVGSHAALPAGITRMSWVVKRYRFSSSCPRSSRASRLGRQCAPYRDGRVKPGHDEREKPERSENRICRHSGRGCKPANPESRSKFGACIWIPGPLARSRPEMTNHFVMAGCVPAIHVLTPDIQRLVAARTISRIGNERAATNTGIGSKAVAPTAHAIGEGERSAAIGFERQFAQQKAEPIEDVITHAIAHIRMLSRA